MSNSNLLKRTLTCIIGIPALFALIWFLPMRNFIGLSILVMVLALLGSMEMSRLVFKKVHFFSYLSWVYVLLSYLGQFTEYYFVFLTMLCIFYNVKRGEKDSFKSSVEKTAKLLLVILYPSFFLSYLVKFFSLGNVDALIIIMYLVLVFSNDIFAYVFGMLFGRNNAGIFKVSPKKSIAGFVGGFLVCVGLSLLLPINSISDKLLIGISTSILANVGDLAESTFKRSANVKDSGNLIPGRGGVLDCLDSICATAPFIFFIFRDIV